MIFYIVPILSYNYILTYHMHLH